MNTQQMDATDQASLLLVDDDAVFANVLARALEKRGFRVQVAGSADAGEQMAVAESPEYAIVDLNMPGGSGLPLVSRLKELDPATRIIVLTGYASISTAVEAIKLGAVHYLTKPADVTEIIQAFHRDEGDSSVEVPGQPMSVNRVEWEHIQKVLADCNGNISEAARRMNMHRRTLQRKLKKRPVRQ